ncbi:MAG: BrnT family toxin [Candidatus Sulfobium sp.]
MRFEWDPAKELTFLEACFVFNDEYMLSIYDEEHSEDEERWITLGAVGARILVVVHTYRKVKGKEVVRIISARLSTKIEEEQYFKRRGK